MTPYRIVTFDGGGIRGYLSAYMLQQLQSEIQATTGQNFLTNMSMFAGTSTGSIIALALAKNPPIDIGTIVHLYESSGKTIFPPSLEATSATTVLGENDLSTKAMSSFSDINIQELWSPKYNNTGLKNVLETQFTDTIISELKTDILVNTFQLWNGTMWSPVEITKQSPLTAKATLVDAALCSSAAPTYFPPYAPAFANPGPNNSSIYFSDGGSFANNPSVTAIMSALEANEGLSVSNIKLLSFGTGQVPEGVSTISDPMHCGIYSWLNPVPAAPRPAFPLLAAMMTGTSQIADRQAKQILSDTSYYRVSPNLTSPIGLDEINSIPAMKQDADDFIKSGEWSKIVNWVSEHFLASTGDH